jgi:hypothetical protein
VQDFLDILVDGGSVKDENGVSPLCYCLGVTDKNKVKLTDQIDIAGWASGPSDFCKPLQGPNNPPT